jgi:hypothetical protein
LQTKIDSIRTFAEHVVVSGRKGGLTYLQARMPCQLRHPLCEGPQRSTVCLVACAQVLPLKGKDGKEVKGESKGESKQQQSSYNTALLAGPPHTLELKENLNFVDFGANEEFEADCFRLVYESFLTPRSVYDFYFASKQLVLRKEKGTTKTFFFRC